MIKKVFSLKIICLSFLFAACENDDGLKGIITDSPTLLYSCEDAVYSNWEQSQYVLPYPVGSSYKVELNSCSSSYHAPGLPDQFAIDFNMPIGTLITASRPGSVVYVEESGEDFQTAINNVVIVSHGGNVYSVYAHLTKNGASVQVGDFVGNGSPIGYSGATGLAGYPHLHFVVIYTEEFWFPYDSIPINFKNTIPNPTGPDRGVYYEAF